MLALLVLWSALQFQETWDVALERGDFRSAWQRASALEEPAARARAQAQILYRGGDPAGALQCAELGLRLAPQELELLFYATGAALWLQEPVRARRYGSELSVAVEQAELAPEPRAAWRKTAADFDAGANALALNEAARNRAVRLSRAVSIAMLAAAGAGLVLATRQGKSSKPVS